MNVRLDSMMMTHLESYVDLGYRLAGSTDPNEVLYPSVIARRTHGPGSIKRLRYPVLLGERGVSNGRPFYGIASWLRGAAFQFTVAHEHAHYLFDLDGFRPPQIELCCDYVAAALMLRRRPFVTAAMNHGRDFPMLAGVFETTQTMVALRIGEVFDVPVAVVAKRVRARGPARWPDERELREVARRGAPGIARVRLTDDRRRVALVGDDSRAA